MLQKSGDHQLRLVVEIPFCTNKLHPKVIFLRMSESSTVSFLAKPLSQNFEKRAGIVGIGILSLPAGIAAGTGLVTGLLILIAMYVASWLQLKKDSELPKRRKKARVKQVVCNNWRTQKEPKLLS